MSEHTTFPAAGESERLRVASANARATFKYFWRELSWEYRRIVPGLGMAAVKLAFANPDAGPDDPPVEHMWIGDIQFDGSSVSGVLMNEPEWITGLAVGAPVSVPLAEIEDWIYTQEGRAYGGYTIDAMRADMNERERREHDQAWGLDFGTPGQVQVVPSATRKKGGLLSALWSKPAAADPADEHPMSENMADKVEEALRDNPSVVKDVDEAGWSMLHREALAGNYTPVAIMLRHGADPLQRNDRGESR